MLKVEGKKFDWINIPLGECLRGNSLDTYYTIKVFDFLLEKVKDVGLEKLYERLISPSTQMFRDIELEGLNIDENKLKEIKNDLLQKIEELKKGMYSDYFPKDYKFSGNNLLEIIYSLQKDDEGNWILTDKGFGLYPFEKTTKGQPSTDDECLTKMRELVNMECIKRGLVSGEEAEK